MEGCLAQIQMHIHLLVSTGKALERHLEGPSQGSRGCLWLQKSCLSQTLAHLNFKESLGPGCGRYLLDKMAGVTGVWAWTVSLDGQWLSKCVTG